MRSVVVWIGVLCGVGLLGSISDAQETGATGETCKESPFKLSQAMIRTLLADLDKTYAAGGSGISSIRRSATRTYIVLLPQEERVDLITYELAIDARCTVTVLSRTPSTITPRSQSR